MIKQMAWNIFKNTGDINTFLELMEVTNIEKRINDVEKVETYEACKNKRDNNCRT